MSPILFSQNDKPVAVFDDKKLFKSKSFHYILDILIKQGYFKTKKQCTDITIVLVQCSRIACHAKPG